MADLRSEASSAHVTLLGNLGSRMSVITRQGEVIATEGLRHILASSAQARIAFADYVGADADPPLTPDMTFSTEVREELGGKGRADLVGEREGRRQLVVEAKLGADLTADQLLSYALRLPSRVLAVLVPAYRQQEARAVLDEVVARCAGREAPATSVLTWEEVFDRVNAATSERHVLEDVRQLEGLCAALTYLDRPITQSDLGESWERRVPDFIQVIDLATKAFVSKDQLARPNPFQFREPWQGLRWVTMWRGGDGETIDIGIGVREPLDAGGTPMWFQLHNGSVDRQRAAEKLSLEPGAQDVNGALLIPYSPPLGVRLADVSAHLQARLNQLSALVAPS